MQRIIFAAETIMRRAVDSDIRGSADTHTAWQHDAEQHIITFAR